MNSTVWAMIVAALMLVFLWQNLGIRRATQDLLAEHISTARNTAKSLNQIHTLVNSNLAKAQQAELDATKRDLASLEEVVDLKTRQGMAISPGSLAVIQQVKERIGELAGELSHKNAQTAEANAITEGTEP